MKSLPDEIEQENDDEDCVKDEPSMEIPMQTTRRLTLRPVMSRSKPNRKRSAVSLSAHNIEWAGYTQSIASTVLDW